MFCDKIDEYLSDKSINVETIEAEHTYQIISRLDDSWTNWRDLYKTAIGQAIIAKGQIQEWRFKLLSETSSISIGIIDNDNVLFRSRKYIGAWYDDELHGYAVYLGTGKKLHDRDHENGKGSFILEYAPQFKVKKNDLVTLTRDLSQLRSRKGKDCKSGY